MPRPPLPQELIDQIINHRLRHAFNETLHYASDQSLDEYKRTVKTFVRVSPSFREQVLTSLRQQLQKAKEERATDKMLCNVLDDLHETKPSYGVRSCRCSECNCAWRRMSGHSSLVRYLEKGARSLRKVSEGRAGATRSLSIAKKLQR